MIQIIIPQNTKNEIEEIHWDWFLQRSSKKFPKTKNNGISYYDYILSKVDLVDNNEINGMNLKEIADLKEKRLHDLITGDPNKNIDQNNLEIKHFDFFIQLNGKKKWSDDEIKDIKKAFGYEDFKKSPDLKGWDDWYENKKNKQWYDAFQKKHNKLWNTKVLCSKLKLEVCPYCNRQYIFSYNKDSFYKNTAEIDHFYPQSIYPFLSCSLYNFIPSCPTCNMIKDDSCTNILYPYTESYEIKDNHGIPYGYFVFKRDKDSPISSYEDLKKCEKKIFLEINPSCSYSAKIDEEKKLFCIEELYNSHTVALEDIIQRFDLNPRKRMRELQLLLGQSEEQIKNVIYGFSCNKEKYEHPLRKLREDIIEYLEKISKSRT